MAENPELWTEIKKYIDELKEEFRARDRDSAELDSRFQETRIDLNKQLRHSFDADVVKHREHIALLYNKFERLVYALVIVGVALAAYLGFSVSTLPDTIDTLVAESKTNIDYQLNVVLDENKDTLVKEFEDMVGSIGAIETEYLGRMGALESGARQELNEVETIRKSAEDSQNKLAGIVDDLRRNLAEADQLRRETEEVLSDIKRESDNKVRELSADVSMLRFAERLPDNQDDLFEFRDALHIAVEHDREERLESLLSLVSYFSDGSLRIAKEALRATFDKMVSEESVRLENPSVLRAGQLIGNESIINWTKDNLRYDSEDKQSVTKIRNILDSFSSPRMYGRANLLRFFSSSIQAPRTSTYDSELVSLLALVNEPDIAKKAMRTLDLGTLSRKLVDQTHNALLLWANTEEMVSPLLEIALPKLPLDQYTGRFYVEFLRTDNSIDVETKRLAVDDLVTELIDADTRSRDSFIRYVQFGLLERFMSDQNKLALEFEGSRPQERRFRVSIREVQGDGRFVDAPFELEVGSSRILVSQGAISQVADPEESDSRTTKITIYGELDGEALFMSTRDIEVDLTENRFYTVLTTSSGKRVLLRTWYDVQAELLNVAFSLGQG